MKIILRGIVIAICIFAAPALAAQFGSAQHAVKDDDGDPIANFDLSADLVARLARLPAQVPVGNLQGDVTLVQSVQGALIEVGASKMLTPEQYFEFHRRIYASRGVIDGPKVLAAAQTLGLDPAKLSASSNTEDTLNVLRVNADFGTAASLAATPAYVIGGVAILGHPGLKPLQTVIRSMRACGKVVC